MSLVDEMGRLATLLLMFINSRKLSCIKVKSSNSFVMPKKEQRKLETGQQTLTQMDYMSPVQNRRTGRTEVEVVVMKTTKVKRECIDSSEDEECKIVQVTPPSNKRVKTKKVKIKQEKVDSSEEEEESSGEEEEVVGYPVDEVRRFFQMEDPEGYADESHILVGDGVGHWFDNGYAGFFNRKVGEMMEEWIDHIIIFVKRIRLEAPIGMYASRRYDKILKILKNILTPMARIVKNHNKVVLKVLDGHILHDHIKCGEWHYTEWIYYFLRSTEFKVWFKPDRGKRTFEIETVFSCGNKWIFGEPVVM